MRYGGGMAKIRITMEATVKGIGPSALEEVTSEMFEIVSEAVEGADYFIEHPETGKEYDHVEVSVDKGDVLVVVNAKSEDADAGE